MSQFCLTSIVGVSTPSIETEKGVQVKEDHESSLSAFEAQQSGMG
eukprot:CAMPEP_0174272130 /NCGR_PEP_ID=MMETSP0439-20130205/50240_1 /TAXON_ID=0 /ORGANISM="Stereomyxa ramosa, Strain Chinc5" /LENGTH=44 /DNA_ID= /DNA_START= /DNA_END= /DNA_ORIENTATION=